MKRCLLLPTVALALACTAQTAPPIEWQKCLGGTALEETEAIALTSDGGSIVVGHTASTNGQVTGFHGGLHDIWVVKLDEEGAIQWQRALGGSAVDYAADVQQTIDGGYIIAGSTNSTNGDVTDSHGLLDCWLIMLNAQGETQWQRTYGGSANDGCHAIKQTSDGGYVFTGYTRSTDGDVSGNNGGADLWVVKINGTGDIQWQRAYGGSFDEYGLALYLTSDGGYVVAGQANSYNGDVTGHHGFGDVWVVKLDPNGDLEWQICFGGSAYDLAWVVVQTNNGGYLAAGWTGSPDGDVTGHHGGDDMWVVKLNSGGDLEWQRAIGGSGTDAALGVLPTADGGLVVAGYTNSNDGDVSGSPQQQDAWLIRFDAECSIAWQQLLGGSQNDRINSLVRTSDGGYLLGATSFSNNGDVSGNHGASDLWIVKLAADYTGLGEVVKPVTMTLYPNPTAGLVTVAFTEPYSSPVNYRWCDPQGRTLRSGATRAQEMNGQGLTLSMDGLAPGAYVLWITVGDRSSGVSVIKL